MCKFCVMIRTHDMKIWHVQNVWKLLPKGVLIGLVTWICRLLFHPDNEAIIFRADQSNCTANNIIVPYVVRSAAGIGIDYAALPDLFICLHLEGFHTTVVSHSSEMIEIENVVYFLQQIQDNKWKRVVLNHVYFEK